MGSNKRTITLNIIGIRIMLISMLILPVLMMLDLFEMSGDHLLLSLLAIISIIASIIVFGLQIVYTIDEIGERDISTLSKDDVLDTLFWNVIVE